MWGVQLAVHVHNVGVSAVHCGGGTCHPFGHVKGTWSTGMIPGLIRCLLHSCGRAGTAGCFSNGANVPLTICWEVRVFTPRVADGDSGFWRMMWRERGKATERGMRGNLSCITCYGKN